jgi:PAS domain S-box-containing protein
VLEITKKIVTTFDSEMLFTTVKSPLQALELIKNICFDCIVTDYQMPEMDGIQLAEHIKHLSEVPIILYTGKGSEEVAERAYAVGVDDYIRKEMHPAHYIVLDNRIRAAVDKSRTETLYRTVLENCPVAYTIIRQGKIIYANNVLAGILGLTDASELLQENFNKWIIEQDRELVAKAYKTAIGKPFQVRALRADNDIRYLDVSISEITYDGEQTHLVFGKDVTDLLDYQRRLEALHRHAVILADAENIGGVCHATMDTIESILDYHLMTCMEVREGALHALESRGAPLIDFSLPIPGRGISVKAAREKRSVLVNDVREDQDYVRGSTDSLSELAVPVMVDGETVGVLNVESLELNSFDENDRRLLETLARYVGATLKRLKLVEADKASKKKLKALHRHATNLVKMDTLDEIAEYTFNIMSELIGFSEGTIGVVDGDSLRFIYFRNVPREMLPDLPLNGKGITVRAVNTGETQMVNDTRRDPDYVRAVEEIGSLSELDIPIKIGETVVAVINIEDGRLNAFTEDDKDILEILSEHVAAAISRIEKTRSLKASEERYRKLFDSSLDSVVILSDTRIEYANRVAAEQLGYDDASELIGQDVSVTLPEEEKERITLMTRSRQRGEHQPSRYELRLAKKNGDVVEVESSVSLIDLDGAPAVVAFSRDITDRKRFEQQIMALHKHAAQLESAETLEQISDATLEAMKAVLGFELASFIVNEKNTLRSIGNIGSGILGLRIPVEGRGITAKAARERRTVLDNDLSGEQNFIRASIDSLSELAVPVMVGGKVAAILNVESTNKNAFTEADAKILETLATHVSYAMARIAKDKQIAQNEEKFRSISDNTDNAILAIDHDRRVSYWNQAAENLLGYTSAEALGRDITTLIFSEENAKLFISQLDSVSKRRSALKGEKLNAGKALARNGEQIDIEYTITLVHYAESAHYVLFIHDVTTRRRYQQKIMELHQSSERLAGSDTIDEVWNTAMDTVGQILGFDFAGIAVPEGDNFRYVRVIGNQSALNWTLSLSKPSITGRAMKTGSPQYVWDTSLDPDYAPGPGGDHRSSEIVLPICVDGEVKAVLNVEGEREKLFNDYDMSLLEILVGQMSSAVGRIIRKEEEVRAGEAHIRDLLEGAMKISSMVRHDLRGPLQTIKTVTYLIREDPTGQEEYIKKIDDCVDYASKILEDLKMAVGSGELRLISVELSGLVEHCFNDVTVPSTVTLVKSLQTPLVADVDPYGIRRIVGNLLKNAVEAMPGGGTLTIETKEQDGVALITITDTGKGIDEAVVKTLFTPFTTTKKKGTGLGLAICKQIVESHGGRISFESKQGIGTCFRVEIPLQAEKPPVDTIVEQIPLDSSPQAPV